MSKTISQFLALGQDADKLHPVAVKLYQEFLDDISKDIPLDTLTENDVKEFLSESDYRNYESGVKSLTEWLAKCLPNNKESTLKVYPSFFPFWGIFKSLLLQVYKRKQYRQMVADAQSQAQARAAEAQRQAQSRAFETKMQHLAFIYQMNRCLKESKNRLAGLKKPQFKCPGWLIGYNPQLWCDPIAVSAHWLSAKLDPLIAQERNNFPQAIRHMIAGSIDYETFFIPRATYERVGAKSIRKGIPVSGPSVPALHWWMAIHVIGIAKIYLMNGIVNLEYDTGVTKQLNCSYNDLGWVYAGPQFWESRWAFYTPIQVLLSAARGGFESKDIEVTDRSQPWSTYSVRNFPEPVPIHDDFARFIREMGAKDKLAQSLLSRGIIDQQVANLINQQVQQLSKLEANAAVPQKADESEKVDGPHLTEAVVDKLMEVGWTHDEAADAVSSITFPADSTADEVVKLIISQ